MIFHCSKGDSHTKAMENLEESFQGKLGFVMRGMIHNDTGSLYQKLPSQMLSFPRWLRMPVLRYVVTPLFPHVNAECSTSQSLYGSMATVTIMPHVGQKQPIGSCVAHMPYSQV